MTYEKFKTLYEYLVIQLCSYKPETIGFHESAAELAELTETYPKFEIRYDKEQN